MMNYPKDLKYTKSHEWVRREGEKFVVGITDYAQREISDIVYVELPKVGREAEKEKGVCVVESVKAAFDIYAPLSGKVKAINTTVESDPGIVNHDPYGKGWLFELELSNPSEWDSLMTSEQYEQHILSGAH